MLPRKKCEEIKAVEMPSIKEYLKEIQRDGSFSSCNIRMPRR